MTKDEFQRRYHDYSTQSEAEAKAEADRINFETLAKKEPSPDDALVMPVHLPPFGWCLMLAEAAGTVTTMFPEILKDQPAPSPRRVVWHKWLGLVEMTAYALPNGNEEIVATLTYTAKQTIAAEALQTDREAIEQTAQRHIMAHIDAQIGAMVQLRQEIREAMRGIGQD